MTALYLTATAASAAAFGLALLSAVGCFSGVLLLVFTFLFALREAVPMLTLTRLSSNGSRLFFNRRDLHWPLTGWFAVGTRPCAVAGGQLLAHVPLALLKRLPECSSPMMDWSKHAHTVN